MQSNYGHRWSSLFKGDIENRMLNAAKAEWRFDLRLYSEPEINKAFEKIKSSYPDFPPSLPEFKRACGEIRQQENMRKNSRRVLSHDPPALSRNRIKHHIRNMRSAIKTGLEARLKTMKNNDLEE